MPVERETATPTQAPITVGQALASDPEQPTASTMDEPAKSSKAVEQVQPVSSSPRASGGERIKRTGKIRQASSAMIEGAAYDPSLRFVLVAVGLFVVFLLLLILSKVML
jgi:hypothetical protein